ncbi:magnesium transporter [Pelagibacterium lacus]|uniref:Magnesium transporter MgtE n=1 Tax=Pelagibacterium lacus TaxID=2282655 RepID=A0A369W946_9HYPH|nr:magnesium transporter [Pelagibacterium lacus]RDE08591.1 magnesium transporter [Pelagibacterium lacus]
MQTKTNDIRDIFLAGATDAVTATLAAEHPADLADALQTLDPPAAWTTLAHAPVARQADIFGYLDHEFQMLLATVMPRTDLAAIVMEMNADDRADLYKELSDQQRKALMPALAQAEREDIRRLASYDEGTAGAIMTSDYAALPPDLSATKALTMLRREAPDKETIYRTYVIDAERRLLGSVRLQDLITAPAQARVADIMEINTHAIRVDDDVEAAARKIAHYDVIALPVVDTDGRLVGIITHDDALDVMEAEATEDFHRVGTVTRLEAGVGTASIPMLYRARIAWLMVLVFGNIFSGAGIAYFEDTIAAHLALMFFLPILIASGGNAGSQSATLMVRALATGEIGVSDWGRVLGRELVVAILLGLSMAAAIAIIGVVRGGPEIALVISLSMVLIVIVGSLIGMLLPFLLSKLNMDPATASTPLVTSIADATGVLIYFSIANVILTMP